VKSGETKISSKTGHHRGRTYHQGDAVTKSLENCLAGECLANLHRSTRGGWPARVRRLPTHEGGLLGKLVPSHAEAMSERVDQMGRDIRIDLMKKETIGEKSMRTAEERKGRSRKRRERVTASVGLRTSQKRAESEHSKRKNNRFTRRRKKWGDD